jgi:carboxymethylenebutenolidase
MQAYIAPPSGTPRGGLMVFQEAFGVNSHIRDVADRFAAEGYLAIAPELFHRTGSGFEGTYTDFQSIMPHIQALTDAGLEADIRASYAWLSGNLPGSLPVCATGYCMGGRVACLAAILLPLAGAISYYGGGIAPSAFFPDLMDRLPSLQAPMLFFWGGLDAHIPAASTRAIEDKLTEAKKPFTNVVFSFADHGFFCDARAAYNAEAAGQAWALTRTFLAQHSK